MNQKEIGRKFEGECVPYLNKIFDGVIWLSEVDQVSAFDFKCIKDGEVFYGDAKFLGSKGSKPVVRHSQRDADFIIAKIGGEIKFYIKGEISKNCLMSPAREAIKYSLNPQPSNIQVTQIKEYGNSRVLVLSPEFMKYHDLKVGDWLDMGDVVKVNKECGK